MSDKLWSRLVLTLLVPLLVVFAPAIVQAQSNLEVFGQNRIQYRKFEWKYFDTKHFRVYHYDKAGRQLGRYVAEEAENDISIIEKKLGGQFPKRFNIILYNSYDEYRQSNVGLKDETPTIGNTRAGTLHIVDDKLVVYFTGEHRDLRHQIRSGMALVVMQRMIFGENFKKMVKNALLLNLPQWVTEGYIAYLVDGWDARANSEWKGVLDANPKKGFYELAEQYPEIAGKAFWKFVANQFGNATTKNLLYSMQQKTSLNKAMKEKGNLNMKVTKAYDSCIKFYKKAYSLDSAWQEKPDSTHGIISLKVPKDNSVVKNVCVSPSGADIGYVVWKDGLYTVYTQKTTGSQQVSTLIEGGQKDLTEQTDPNYPMLAWSGTGDKLAILYKKGTQTLLRIYNNKKSRIENYVIQPNRFDRALSMAFMEDDENLIFSAIKKSQTDLYMFTIKGSKVTNITDDVWDDLSPQFMSGGARTGILFLSNRPKPNMNVPVGVNELPAGPLNVFFYSTKTKSPVLLQCTDVKKGHVSQPIQYGNENFAYLMDTNGINNKYVVMFGRTADNLDSPYSVPVTNYSTSILAHQYSQPTGDVADVVQKKDKYVVYFHDLQMPGDSTGPKKLRSAVLSFERPDINIVGEEMKRPEVKPENDIPERDEPVSRPVIKGGTAFQSEFSDTSAVAPRKRAKMRNGNAKTAGTEPNAADSSLLTELTDSAYVKMKPASYRLSFKPDFLSIRLDNSTIFSQYQSIAANGGKYANPSLGELTSLSLNEVMEDHRITAGFQLPINISASAYFLQYQNFRHRLDWGLAFVRKQDKQGESGAVDMGNGTFVPVDLILRSVSNAVQSDFSYPLDRRRSFRFHTILRQDKVIQKITDSFSRQYDIASAEAYTSLSRFEYVFDNTISPALNILNGMRYKIYTEYMYGLNNGNKSCYNIGFDFRNYKKVYKNFIIANRLAYAHSDGTSQVEYLLGGVDNWIAPQNGPGATQPPGDNYGFQALATSMRGYKQYARVGNNFAVLTTELRLPVITTFMKRPIQSSILKNLMLVGFADAGAAWKGFLPDAQSMEEKYYLPTVIMLNSLNNVNLSLTVPNSGGLALGYGAGLRTSLLGYYVRFDAAWNIDGIRKPMLYFALGTDF